MHHHTWRAVRRRPEAEPELGQIEAGVQPVGENARRQLERSIEAEVCRVDEGRVVVEELCGTIGQRTGDLEQLVRFGAEKLGDHVHGLVRRLVEHADQAGDTVEGARLGQPEKLVDDVGQMGRIEHQWGLTREGQHCVGELEVVVDIGHARKASGGPPRIQLGQRLTVDAQGEDDRWRGVESAIGPVDDEQHLDGSALEDSARERAEDLIGARRERQDGVVIVGGDDDVRDAIDRLAWGSRGSVEVRSTGRSAPCWTARS